MAFAIGISFPAGRFHATPWGGHVNEGIPEWPPAPWRLIRAIVAVWKRKLNHYTHLDDVIPRVISKLASPPGYKLPPAAASHTVHFMPSHAKWKPEAPHRAKDQVFDTFIALDPGAEVIVAWPDVTLDEIETRAIGSVLSRMTYLGRAESLVSVRIADLHDPHLLNCVPLMSSNSSANSGINVETVMVMAPDPDTWNLWSHNNDAIKPEPCWNILVETMDLHAQRWSKPPGSRQITYVFEPSTKRTNIIRRRPSPKTVHIARYALDSQVLPLITDTVYTAELARRYLQGIFGSRFAGAVSQVFSGKNSDGKPLDKHGHAFFLPTDEDADMRLDHLTIFSQTGFDPARELKAIDLFNKMHSPKTSLEINLLLVGTGGVSLGAEVPILSKSIRWRSVTPFIPVRHYKSRGQKKDTCDYEAFPETVLREELLRRGFPEPARISAVARCYLWNHSGKCIGNSAINLSWLKFRRERVFGNGRRGLHPGCGFEIEFNEPVQGPVALGYGCHYGLGLFAPA